MRLGMFIVCSLLLTGAALGAVPSWVQPGLVVSYDGISASLIGGEPQNGVYTVMTTQVDSASRDAVSGTTKVYIPSASMGGWSYSWQTSEGDPWKDVHRFWVDPADPSSSVKGPNGEVLSIVGQEPFSYGGRSWDATLMAYKNEETGTEYHLTFETKTGLILAYTEMYPSQNTFLYFKSISQEPSSQAANTWEDGGNGGITFSKNSGNSIKDAIVISNAKSDEEGVDAEYAYLEKKYGQRNVDWKLITQSLITNNDKDYDKMDIELSDGTMLTVYFDITDFLGKF